MELVAPLEMLAQCGDGTWPGVKLPYYDLAGEPTGHCRYRFLGKPGGGYKYHTPKGERTQIYFPRNGGISPARGQSTGIPIIITEGEKKAVALQEAAPDALVIGLPGVWNYSEPSTSFTKTLHIQLASLAWKKRDVYIAFDNDGNPQVRYAAARLSSLLEARGAVVYHVLFTLPGMEGKKVGADDFLVGGGDLSAALELARMVPMEVELDRIPAMVNLLNGRLAYDRSTAMVLDMDHDLFLKPGQLANHIPVKVQWHKANGQVGIIPATRVWIENRYRTEIRGKTFRPGENSLITHDGFFNIYKGPAVDAIYSGFDEEMALWDRLLYGLCCGLAKDEKKWFVQRMAWIYQHPETRPMSACILRSDKEGVGKSLLLGTLVALAGAHGRTLTDSSMGKAFNSEYEGALVIHFEEVSSGRGIETRNFIKTLITAPEIICNRKFVPAYEIENYANVFMSSNHAAPLGITSSYDRRMFVISVPDDAPLMEPEEFARLAVWLATPTGLGRVLGWLLGIDTEDFKPGSAPPSTEAKRAVIDASQSQVVQWMEQVVNREIRFVDTQWGTGPLAYEEQPEGEELCSGMGIIAGAHAYLKDTGSGARYSDRAILAQLKQRGLINPVMLDNSKDGRWKVNGRKVSVFAVGRKSVLHWEQASPEELRDRLAAL
jgi:hypothetical protein